MIVFEWATEVAVLAFAAVYVWRARRAVRHLRALRRSTGYPVGSPESRILKGTNP